MRDPHRSHHHRSAVEYEIVLTADLVHVDHRAPELRRPRDEHRLALGHPFAIEGRAVDVEHNSRAVECLSERRSPIDPGVLADAQAYTNSGDLDRRLSRRPRLEPTVLVEHVVCRKHLLAVDRLHGATATHRGSVVPASVVRHLRKPDDGYAIAGHRGDLIECLATISEEATLQEEVFGGVSADSELAEDGDIGAVFDCLGVGGLDRVDIRVERADRGIQLTEGNAHDLKL